MASLNFHLKIRPELMGLLKHEATQQKISLNSLILNILDRELGTTSQTGKAVFHDLDHLAGTWDDKDITTFNDRIKLFVPIDSDLWV